MGYRINFLISLLLLITASGLQAQSQDSLHAKSVWVGLEVPSIIAHPIAGGYAFQPMLVFNFSKYGSAWVGGGLVKTTRDTIFNNLYDYSSQGWYVKGGAALNLNFNTHRTSGFRLGGGINIARFTESGLLQFQYGDGIFEDARSGNTYGHKLESSNLAIAFEFRQGLFIDIRKWGLLFQIQESLLIREPERSHHPAYYIPGTGIFTPIAFLARGNARQRSVIPAAYVYLFYRLN